MSAGLRLLMSPHRLILAALAIAHFLVASGLPFPTFARQTKKPTDRPFPCMDRPCGCLTYELCWAGDCCCFTMAEKLAWAQRNGITPPASACALVLPTVAKIEEPECEHCVSKKKPTTKNCCEPESQNNRICEAVTTKTATPDEVDSRCCEASTPITKVISNTRWISGLFAQKCQGKAFQGLSLLPVAVVPDSPAGVSFDATEIARLPVTNHLPTVRVTPPDVPPPIL